MTVVTRLVSPPSLSSETETLPSANNPFFYTIRVFPRYHVQNT